MHFHTYFAEIQCKCVKMFPSFYPHLSLLRAADRSFLQRTLSPTGCIIGDPRISLRFEISQTQYGVKPCGNDMSAAPYSFNGM